MELTRGEKLILLMLSEIYDHLKLPRSVVNAQLVQDAIIQGQTWALDWETQGVAQEETPPTVADEVAEILGAWFQIEMAESQLSVPDRQELARRCPIYGAPAQFDGFDGNNEIDHMAAAEFMITKVGRFGHFAGRNLNSHMPTLDDHRAIAERVKEIRASRGPGAPRFLTLDEITHALGA